MAYRFRGHARRRALLAAIAGFSMVVFVGPALAVPALAFVALVFYVHQLAAVMAGDEQVPYPSLAFVIVVNATIVLFVQALLAYDAVRST
jgi:hypothetical protein